LDNAKIEHELGWRPEVRFEDGLSRTVDWYREHPEWWQPLKERLARESRGFWTDFTSPTKDQMTKDVP
jgi:dTDP-glucose 4,6-dehydratase